MGSKADGNFVEASLDSLSQLLPECRKKEARCEFAWMTNKKFYHLSRRSGCDWFVPRLRLLVFTRVCSRVRRAPSTPGRSFCTIPNLFVAVVNPVHSYDNVVKNINS